MTSAAPTPPSLAFCFTGKARALPLVACGGGVERTDPSVQGVPQGWEVNAEVACFLSCSFDLALVAFCGVPLFLVVPVILCALLAFFEVLVVFPRMAIPGVGCWWQHEVLCVKRVREAEYLPTNSFSIFSNPFSGNWSRYSFPNDTPPAKLKGAESHPHSLLQRKSDHSAQLGHTPRSALLAVGHAANYFSGKIFGKCWGSVSKVSGKCQGVEVGP